MNDKNQKLTDPNVLSSTPETENITTVSAGTNKPLATNEIVSNALVEETPTPLQSADKQVQFVSPMDPPPPPPPMHDMPIGGNIDKPLTEANAPATSGAVSTTSAKPRSKSLVTFLFLLVILLVWGAVGFMAYQNFTLKNSVQTEVQVQAIPTPSPDPFANWQQSSIQTLPITVVLPLDWKLTESENPNLGNQKLVTVQSPNFAYEGSAIASGYEFRIGPVNDLTKKYKTFAEFAAVENKDASLEEITINGTVWLKGKTTAKTLLAQNPITVAIYSSDAELVLAEKYFNKILQSFTFTATTTVTPAVSVTPTPTKASATPTLSVGI